MTPERRRALDRLEARRVRWYSPSEPITVLTEAYEEIEHMRPVIDAAKALVAAKSGEQRALAIERIFAAVEKLRKSGH